MSSLGARIKRHCNFVEKAAWLAYSNFQRSSANNAKYYVGKQAIVMVHLGNGGGGGSREIFNMSFQHFEGKN